MKKYTLFLLLLSIALCIPAVSNAECFSNSAVTNIKFTQKALQDNKLTDGVLIIQANPLGNQQATQTLDQLRLPFIGDSITITSYACYYKAYITLQHIVNAVTKKTYAAKSIVSSANNVVNLTFPNDFSAGK